MNEGANKQKMVMKWVLYRFFVHLLTFLILIGGDEGGVNEEKSAKMWQFF